VLIKRKAEQMCLLKPAELLSTSLGILVTGSPLLSRNSR